MFNTAKIFLSSDITDESRINYIRNSVKAVIDAYNGKISFYISDTEDVIIRVYARIFPDLFRPLADMSELRRVIVAYENNVVMEENLELALTRLFSRGGNSPVLKEEAKRVIRESAEDLPKEALRLYEKALQRQREGDWAGYGEQIKQLGELLQKLAR